MRAAAGASAVVGYISRMKMAALNTFARAAVAAALLAVMPSLAQAQTAHGAGNTTCQQFLRAARSSDIVYHQASNWLLGYVSGMNAALRASGSAAVVTLGNDQLMKSAGDYCEANPARTIADAAGEWYRSVPRQPVVQEPPPPASYDHLKKPFARPSKT